MASKKNTPIVIAVSLAALVVAIGSVGVWYLTDFIRYDRYDKQDFIDPNTYQALFLTNDQIYFGHLKDINDNYLILSDVYYVKINEKGDSVLVKLGTIEPHGPKGSMIVNKDQALFWENLRPDSQVIKTIESIQSK